MIRLTLLLTLLLLWSSADSTATSAVILSPLTVTLKTGESVQAQATAYDELGHEISDAKIQWLPTADSGPHCVSVNKDVVVDGVIDASKAVIVGATAGSCGVGALSVTSAGKVITHQEPITIIVSEPVPEPSPTPTPDRRCKRSPHGKCPKGCVCS